MTAGVDERRWSCPNCPAAARTVTAKVPWHDCPGLLGLSAPLVDERDQARVVPVDRQDYVGAELVQTDGAGRPVMGLRVDRYDGSNDAVVYAPTATASVSDVEEAAHGG